MLLDGRGESFMFARIAVQARSAWGFLLTNVMVRLR